MIYAKVYGCIRMHIDCRLGSAIFFYKNCPQFSKDIINNRSGCFFMEHSVYFRTDCLYAVFGNIYRPFLTDATTNVPWLQLVSYCMDIVFISIFLITQCFC